MPENGKRAEEAAISVCVVATNSRAYIEELLPSIYRSAGRLPIEVLLIDNGSSDGVSEAARGWPRLRVIRHEQRLGFSDNHNIAIHEARAEYLLVVNPDVVCLGDTLSAAHRFMEGRPRCGVCACAVFHKDGAFAHPARRFQTLASIGARRLPWVPWRTRIVRDHLYQRREIGETFDCDWISGCFMFFRRAALDEVGPFDPRFPKYFEDEDICWRMWRAGWEVNYFGGASILHHEQRASKKPFSRAACLHLESYRRWLGKHGVAGFLGRRPTVATQNAPLVAISAAEQAQDPGRG